MVKSLPLGLCLLTGILLNPGMAKAESSLPATTEYLAAEPATQNKAILTPEDLPPGFQTLPPEIASQLASQLDFFRQQLGPGAPEPEDLFVLLNRRQFQIVLGFTGEITSAEQQADFDAGLEKLQQPEVQKEILALMQENLQAFPGLRITDYTSLAGLDNIADSSVAVTVSAEMQGMPLRFDIVSFRRDSFSAVTGIMYLESGKPLVSLEEVANKLDQRLLKLSSQ